MSSRLAIAWFVIKLVGIYALIAAPWPGWKEATSETVAQTVHYLACDVWGGLPALRDGRGIAGTSGWVQVGSVARSDPNNGNKPDFEHDIHIGLANLKALNKPNPSPPLIKKTSSGFLVVAPLAFFLALVVATPMPWKRRLKTLLIGGTLCVLFCLSRFAILIFAGFYGDDPHSLYTAGPFWTEVLGRALGFMTAVMATSYLVPLIIWLAVAFKRDDADRLVAWLSARSGTSAK